MLRCYRYTDSRLTDRIRSPGKHAQVERTDPALSERIVSRLHSAATSRRESIGPDAQQVVSESEKVKGDQSNPS